MKVKPDRQQLTLFAALALLMVATRFHHFGSPVNLPDASLAVFFLAGIYLNSALMLPLLLLGAGLIDYLAINVGGVSDWCASPAYWFLIPTYACLWFSGRWYAKHHRMSWSTIFPLAAALWIATTVAFLISNASFYAFSGYFPQMSWTEYGVSVAKYYPRYAGSAFFYVALVAIGRLTVTALRPLATWRIER